MGDDDWVWLDSHDERRNVERYGEHEYRIHGRIWCSFPDGRREWSEPFLTSIKLSPMDEVCDYTLWFSSCATMLDLSKVRALVRNGQVVAPPPPTQPDDWAFVFQMGER